MLFQTEKEKYNHAKTKLFTHLSVSSEELKLLIRFGLELSPVLTERLKLVDEFIDHIPQPRIGKLHIHIPMKNDLEKVAIVVPRFYTLVQGGGQASIDMTKPQLSVEKAEDVVVVDIRRDGLDDGPGRVLEHPVAELLEASLVHLEDFVDVLLPDVAVEVDDEALDDVGDEGGVVVGALLLQVAGILELGALVVGVVVDASAIAVVRHSHEVELELEVVVVVVVVVCAGKRRKELGMKKENLGFLPRRACG
jgi:hypothetical protein